METAALIVAAGMSSRMGDFKPMLNLGSISVVKRVIANFQQAGITKIVVITGYNATTLEHHLVNLGLIFLRNENYSTTHMFDSACIGLDYLKDKCDRLLFTPVDIPLFTADTVKKLLQSEAALASPVHNGEAGHPIMISSRLIPSIIDDHGEGGLKGALSRCGEEMTLIEVNDAGILQDADTPDDFEKLLKYHNSQLIRPVVDISLSKEISFFDDRMYMLLSIVRETGSVRDACRRIQISYSTGWNIIRTLETQLGCSLVERSQGGTKSGRSRLSQYGESFLQCYEGYRNDVRGYAETKFSEYFDKMFN